MSANEDVSKSKRLHDLRGVSEGMKMVVQLMRSGYQFKSEEQGEKIAKTVEKYIEVVNREIAFLAKESGASE